MRKKKQERKWKSRAALLARQWGREKDIENTEGTDEEPRLRCISCNEEVVIENGDSTKFFCFGCGDYIPSTQVLRVLLDGERPY